MLLFQSECFQLNFTKWIFHVIQSRAFVELTGSANSIEFSRAAIRFIIAKYQKSSDKFSIRAENTKLFSYSYINKAWNPPAHPCHCHEEIFLRTFHSWDARFDLRHLKNLNQKTIKSAFVFYGFQIVSNIFTDFHHEPIMKAIALVAPSCCFRDDVGDQNTTSWVSR